jgi:hypothetical protein
MRSVAQRKYVIDPITALNCSSKGVVYLLLLLLLYAVFWTAAAQQEDYISLRVKADPCVTISAFDQTALAPVKGERDGEIWNFRVPKGHWLEISVRTDGTCKVTGILEVSRNLITPGERAFWHATYDADFEVRVEKPSLYVTVVGEPRGCLSKVTTDPESRVEIANGTAKVGPFYRESAVVLSVVPAETCEVVRMTVVGVPGSYGASSINLWVKRDVEVRATFRVIGAEKGGRGTKTTIAPTPQRTSTSLPSIPHELLVSILATSTVLGTFAAVRVLRKKRKEGKDHEVREAPYVLRQWAYSGKITSVVLGLLSSEAAIKYYKINELLTAAKKGTRNIEKLDRYQRGSSSLLTSDAFKNLNSDPIALHVATHLIAAGLIPATYERRRRLRNELLPRWVRMIREGRYDDAVKEAHEFVRDLKRDPNEKLYSETIKEAKENRHPFVQELINAALEELGEVIQPPVKEPERPAEREKAVHEQREAPVKVPAAPITTKEEEKEVKPKSPAELYALARNTRIRFVKVTAPASVVGGAALIAAFKEDSNSLKVLAELMRLSDLRVEPVDLETDAVYFPAERTDLEEAVVELTSKEHLACLVADAVGGTPVPAEPEASLVHGAIIVDRGVDEDVLALASMAREKGLPVRIATYSKERALLLASRLNIKAIGIKGLAEMAAAFLLGVVGAVEPRLFRALVGFSLLVPDFKMKLRPPVTMEKLDAAPSSSCHPVKGLTHITGALKMIAAGEQQSAVAKGLEKEMGELGSLAATILELRSLDSSRERLTEVEVIEPDIVEPPQEVPPDPDIILEHIVKGDRIRAEVTPQVVGSIALKANEAALKDLISRIRSGEISVREDELPEGIYYPDEETSALVSGLVEEEHMACVLAKALGRGFEVDIGGMPSGRLIATWSEERALELSSALGLPVFRIEYLPQILAYRVLVSSGEMKEMKMISSTELKMAVGLSLIFEGLPEALSAGSLRIALAVASHCGRHEVPRDLLMGLLSVDLVRLVTMESERAVEEIRTRTGLRSVEAEKLLKLLKYPFGKGSLERLEVKPVNEWLRLYRHQDGYWKVKVDGKRASYRAAVQLGDGETCVVPANFPVISIGMDVYELESLCKRRSIKDIEEDDIVIKVGKLFRGIKIEKRNYEERLLSLSDEIQGKLVPVGFFDRELEYNLEKKGFEVVRIYHDVREQAEKGAKRLLGEGADYRVFRALSNILMFFPEVATVKGRTRSELAEEASRIISNLLEDADDGGYISLLSGAVRVLIGERRLLRSEEVSTRMRRVAETLGLLEFG